MSFRSDQKRMLDAIASLPHCAIGDSRFYDWIVGDDVKIYCRTGHTVQIEPGLQPASPKAGIFQVCAGDFRPKSPEKAQIGYMETCA